MPLPFKLLATSTVIILVSFIIAETCADPDKPNQFLRIKRMTGYLALFGLCLAVVSVMMLIWGGWDWEWLKVNKQPITIER